MKGRDLGISSGHFLWLQSADDDDDDYDDDDDEVNSIRAFQKIDFN